MIGAEQEVGLEICPSQAAAARRAAEIVIARVRSGPSATLGLATGGTMLPVYAELVAAYRAGAVSFAGCTSFNLDEYVGLGPDHPASFCRYMREHFLAHVDLPRARAFLPDGLARDPLAEAARYEAAIAAAGGIDLQLLGIGQNGHIGFNEPGSPLDSRTREIRLAEETRAANAPFFPAGEAVPRCALTMGIGTILDARELVLVATGPEKSAAVAAALQGPVSPDCPASALRLHAKAHIVCDAAAAAEISRDRHRRAAGSNS